MALQTIGLKVNEISTFIINKLLRRNLWTHLKLR
jgi:hypothetical protein